MSNNLDYNLTRLSNARTNIASAITAKGGTVGQNDGFEDFVSDITTIPSINTNKNIGTITKLSKYTDYYLSGSSSTSYVYDSYTANGYQLEGNYCPPIAYNIGNMVHIMIPISIYGSYFCHFYAYSTSYSTAHFIELFTISGIDIPNIEDINYVYSSLSINSSSSSSGTYSQISRINTDIDTDALPVTRVSEMGTNSNTLSATPSQLIFNSIQDILYTPSSSTQAGYDSVAYNNYPHTVLLKKIDSISVGIRVPSYSSTGKYFKFSNSTNAIGYYNTYYSRNCNYQLEILIN